MPPDLRGIARRYGMHSHPVGFWLWSASACALTVLVVMLLGRLFFAGSLVTQQAIDNGQRVIVHIASGEIEGNPRHTAPEKTEPLAGAPDAGAQSKADSGGLAPAPLVTLIDQSDKGPIPVAGHDGTLPWKYYARPFAAKEKRPEVAIVITDMGLSKSLTQDALSLPPDYTLSFSPYASDAKAWAAKARAAGFESLVDLPMEPADYPLSDAGPYGLMEDVSVSENTARLHWVLSRFPGFTGTLAPVNEKLTANIAALRPSLTELTARGLLFVYLKNPRNAAIAELAKSHSVYALGADLVVDEEISQGAIEKQLQTLVDTARKQGFAIGIAHTYPPTTAALRAFAESAPGQGIDIVPVSAIGLQVFP